MTSGKWTPDKLRKLRKKIRENPRWFTRKVLGEDSWELQDQILESVRDNIRTAVGACHAPGKTRTAARAVIEFLLGYKNSKVLTTAPTWRQVEQLLWAEIRGLIEAAPYDLGLKLPPKACEAYITPTWYAVGLSTNQPERFQGYHAPSILIIIDEASGVSDEIFEAIQGIMASGGTVRILLLSNTTRAEGFFYEASRSPLWNYIPIPAIDTPNFAGIREAYLKAKDRDERLAILRSVPDTELVRDYLVKPSWMADLLEEFGEDSQVFNVRAMARFPNDEPDQLFPLAVVEAAQHRWEHLRGRHWWQTDDKGEPIRSVGGNILRKPDFYGHLRLGCDIARYGTSESGYAPRAAGIVGPLETWTKTPATHTGGRITSAARDLLANKTVVDSDGMGGPVYDICLENGVGGLVEFHGGGAAHSRRFLNRRCELYFQLKASVEAGLALPPCPKLAAQLSILKYWEDSKGRLCVSTKDQLRADKKASPDRADMVMMTEEDTPGLEAAKLGQTTLHDWSNGWLQSSTPMATPSPSPW